MKQWWMYKFINSAGDKLQQGQNYLKSMNCEMVQYYIQVVIQLIYLALHQLNLLVLEHIIIINIVSKQTQTISSPLYNQCNITNPLYNLMKYNKPALQWNAIQQQFLKRIPITQQQNAFMSSQITQQYIKKLQAYYDQVNTQQNQHITQDQLKHWMNLCLNDQDISQDSTVQQVAVQFQQAFEMWVDGYLREVCGLETDTIEKLEFKREEVLQFFGWVLDSQGGQDQAQGEEGQEEANQNNWQQDQQNQSPQNIQKNISKLSENKSSFKENKSSFKENKSSFKENESSFKENKSSFKENKSSLKSNPSQVSQKTKNNPSVINNSNTHQQHQKTNLFTQQQPNQFSQNLTHSQPVHQTRPLNQLKNLQPTPLTQDDQRYKQYLQTIFEHYCKISFGLAKDNTFESMQKNVSIITMNKFMIFANDFELNVLLAASLPKQNNQRPNKIQIRNLLMDVFKKNSAFHKEMNFQHFLIALNKLAETCFTKIKPFQDKNQPKEKNQLKVNNQLKEKPSDSQLQHSNPNTKYSFEMVKMIRYLQISSFKQFKQKMTKFNINFSLRFNKQLQQKKLPINYKFKFQSEENLRKLSQHMQNQKSLHNQNRPPVVLPTDKRNIVLKQGQQNVNRSKYSLQMGKPPLQNKMSTPNMMSLAHNNNNNPNNPAKDRKITSNKNISSHQKLTNVPSNRDRNIINFNNNPPQKVTKQSLQYLYSHIDRKLRTPPPMYEGVLEGYANIHLAKKGLLPVDQSKNGAMKKKGEFQLNNVIEQARKQALDLRVHYDYLESRSGRALSNISASKPLSHYSRDPASNQSNRQSRNDEQLDILRPTQSYSKQMKKNFTQVPVISKNNSRVSVHNELEGLIDFNDSDEDEYLHQHLRKEKENDTEITVRVQKKISSLSYKV